MNQDWTNSWNVFVLLYTKEEGALASCDSVLMRFCDTHLRLLVAVLHTTTSAGFSHFSSLSTRLAYLCFESSGGKTCHFQSFMKTLWDTRGVASLPLH